MSISSSLILDLHVYPADQVMQPSSTSYAIHLLFHFVSQQKTPAHKLTPNSSAIQRLSNQILVAVIPTFITFN
jgi:hypothetical protein